MKDRLDTFIDQLQDRIFDETKEAYGINGFNRWRNPLYSGRLESPDAYARVTGQCGDTMQIFLNFENNRVKKASYITDGCGSSIVCGSFTAELATGKTPDELAGITGESILKKIGSFPKEDEHCAFLSAETLQKALDSYMKTIAQKNKTTIQ